MATKKPRFSMTIDNDTLESITEFQKREHYSRRNDAIAALVRIGLKSYLADASAADNEALRRRLDGLRYDSHTRALLEATKDMTAKDIDQMEAFARFLRRDKD